MTKPTKWSVHPTKTQISLSVRPVWSEPLLSVWRKLGSLPTYWAHSEDSDQTGRMPRLIWVFAGRTCHFVGFVTRRLNCALWNDPKFADRQVWANSVDPDQTAPRLLLEADQDLPCFVILFVSFGCRRITLWSSFRVTTANFSGVQIFRIFTVHQF